MEIDAATEAELDVQAQEMAEKALAALPESARAAKIDKVKEGILKRLRNQAIQAASSAAAPAANLASSADNGRTFVATDSATPAQRPAAAQGAAPEPPPPPSVEEVQEQPRVKIEGVEACGDDPWFADQEVRRAVRESVIAAHAEQKILVGVPADEIRRICPGGGRVLAAGGVLRLGGATLGGYGEADISYAYRQLSRALHPDKNPNIPEAPDAFKRLSEAADELRQGLNEQRSVLTVFCSAMGGAPTPDMTERPQEALLAEATRVISAVLALSGEGEVPQEAANRALTAFLSSKCYPTCQMQLLSAEWWDGITLVEHFAGASLRAAYDCAPKRFRAQFLCALNRSLIAEAQRNQDCVRGNWQGILAQYPEIHLWRDFREKLKLKVWTPDPDVWNEDAAAKKKSRWDEKVENCSAWAKKWRNFAKLVLPKATEGAAPPTDPEVMKLSAALWQDVVEWARLESEDRALSLFTAEPGGRTYVARGIEPPADGQLLQWAFVPAMDLLLVVGEGIVGYTAEGVFVENSADHERMTFEAALRGEQPKAKKSKDKEKDEDKRDKSQKRSKSRGRRDKSREKDEKKKMESDPNFDWEKEWRSRVDKRKREREEARGGSPVRSKRDRSRSRARRRRSVSRDRERRRDDRRETVRSRSRRRAR